MLGGNVAVAATVTAVELVPAVAMGEFAPSTVGFVAIDVAIGTGVDVVAVIIVYDSAVAAVDDDA